MQINIKKSHPSLGRRDEGSIMLIDDGKYVYPVLDVEQKEQSGLYDLAWMNPLTQQHYLFRPYLMNKQLEETPVEQRRQMFPSDCVRFPIVWKWEAILFSLDQQGILPKECHIPFSHEQLRQPVCKQQSEHWNQRKNFRGGLVGDYPGFPFNEPWPSWYTHQSFTILTYRGMRYEGAMVDDSRQYRNEGIQWQTSSGPVGKHLVIAWKEED